MANKFSELNPSPDFDVEQVSFVNRQSVRMKKAEKGFLNSILPKSGYICVVEQLPAKSEDEKALVRYKWFDSGKAAAKHIKSFKDPKIQIFVAQASFMEQGTEKTGRKQKDVAYLRGYFLDIDCGTGKPYATQVVGKIALLSFCKKAGLPVPAIVNSGNGLYAHWPLKKDEKEDVWKAGAKKLKELVRAIDPGLDNDGIIADSARILRPVGSYNRKSSSNPKLVKLLEDCEPIDFRSFLTQVEKGIAEFCPALGGTENTCAPSAQDVVNKSYSAIKIADKCAVVADFREKKGAVSEPIWYATIGLLKHCFEAPEIILDWSNGHSNYSRKETDDKIVQWDVLPTTCGHFDNLCPELCRECQHKGEIKSPISLGSSTPLNSNFPEYVETLNKEYFVSRLGGKTVVFRETYDLQLKRKLLEKSSFADFRNYYNNLKANVGTNRDGTPISSPLGNAWLEHENRRQFKGIIMSPEGDEEGYYNLWRGFSIEPTEGSWELIKRHIRNVICNSDKMLYRYVIRWLARLIQEPWTPGEVALVLRGGRGIGKGILANNMCRIFGQHSCSVRNSKHVTGNFNAHMDDCILLYVDEAFWAGNKQAESVLKGIITEPTLFIEPKNIDGKEKRNMLHVIMTSNNDWVVPAGSDERRFCVLEVSGRCKGKHKYFKALINEINNGGLAAMLYYLKNMDISGFEVRDVPNTDALIKQKLLSLEPVHSWWWQKLQDGELLPGVGWNIVLSQYLYDDYVDCAKKQGINWRGTQTLFGIELHKLLPANWPKKRRQSSKNEFGIRGNQYEFPSLTKCRKYFETFLGVDSLNWE